MATKEGKTQKKQLTLRDRKRAQPNAKIYFSPEEKTAIVETVAKNLSLEQVNIFFYQCQALGLNPLINEICAVPYKDRKTGKTTLSIQIMRDGFLTIAHRSGKFAGMKSGVKDHPLHIVKEGEVAKTRYVGWAKVYHKDFKFPVYQEADFEEYDNSERNLLWKTKPKTMIKKVAESMALRKAFNVSGVYASEEMELEIVKAQVVKEPLKLEDGGKPASKTQIATIRSLIKTCPKDKLDDHDVHLAIYGKDLSKITKQQAADLIGELTRKKGKKK
jgi:phage recombination protein Bet